MMDLSRESMTKRYDELCAVRDRVNAQTEALKARREEANLRCEKARLEAAAITAEISKARGGGDTWVAMKRDIATLARALGRVPAAPVA